MKAFGRIIVARMTRRRLMAAGLDLLIVILAYWLALAFRFAGSVPESTNWGSRNLSIFLAAAVVVHLGLNTVFRVYSIVNRYVGLPQARWMLGATTSSIVVLLALDLAWPTGAGHLVPLSVILVGGIGTGLAMTAVRFYSRVFQVRSLRPVQDAKRVLLVGAGSAAEMLVRQIDRAPQLKIRIAGLVDDDPRLKGMRIHSYPILGTMADAVALAAEHDVGEFVIAIPSADAKRMQEIYNLLKPAHLPIKTLPP
ncbi:MAG: hypothetical protein JW990_10565, partial [Thermoleophilia bacterium]|nr:hypothetical protein [Thermoleophilia bacterium]